MIFMFGDKSRAGFIKSAAFLNFMLIRALHPIKPESL